MRVLGVVVKHSLGELGIATYAAAHVIGSTGNFLYPSQCYLPLLADDVLTGGVAALTGGRLALPTGPGLGVTLDPERVARYADLYHREGAEFSFTGSQTATPHLPKR
ncbi:MAG: enolase C-terminal domain-like protein [Micromonosporaceae bacterium]